MKRVPSTLLFVAAVTFGLLVGALLVQYRFVNKEKALGLAFEEAFLDQYAKKEFVYADPQSAREALAYAVKTHKSMEGASPLRGWPEKLDLGWCFADLSVLEESTGNARLASDNMSQAQQIFKELGWKDFSATHIRELVHRTARADLTSGAEPK